MWGWGMDSEGLVEKWDETGSFPLKAYITRCSYYQPDKEGPLEASQEKVIERRCEEGGA